MQSNLYGISRILSTYGKPGDVDAIIDILNEYTTHLSSNPDCLSFYYGTITMPPSSDSHVDPFSVWVNEIWTSESERSTAFQKDEIAKLEQNMSPYLEFKPEKGVEIEIRGGKFMTNSSH